MNDANFEKRIKNLEETVKLIERMLNDHTKQLNDKKEINDSYINTILSKIDILKNIIIKNMDGEDLISQHLLMVESIENQIKKTGKISDSQFHELNTIYKIQKNMK